MYSAHVRWYASCPLANAGIPSAPAGRTVRTGRGVDPDVQLWDACFLTFWSISVLALHDQMLPPTMNPENPDPECDLDYVPNQARKAEVEYAMSNSFGFGATNGALLFGRWTE